MRRRTKIDYHRFFLFLYFPLQVSALKLWCDKTLKEALDEPRIYHQLMPMIVQYEYGTTKVTITTTNDYRNKYIECVSVISGRGAETQRHRSSGGTVKTIRCFASVRHFRDLIENDRGDARFSATGKFIRTLTRSIKYYRRHLFLRVSSDGFFFSFCDLVETVRGGIVVCTLQLCRVNILIIYSVKKINKSTFLTPLFELNF